MQRNNIIYNPFIRTQDTTSRVMADVVVALLPSIVMAYMAFGVSALSLIAVSVGSALVAEFVFSLVFNHRIDTLGDGSAVVTGLLLAFTLGAFTPLHVVSFGAAMAVIFGKLLWGGLGRNVFNPALVGREFMTVFFPSVMTSGSIWWNMDAVNHTALHWTGNSVFDQLLFNPSGAVGEYSIAGLVLGGLYLLLRRRISWHIPFSLLAVFIVVLYFASDGWTHQMHFSLGGLILGAVFMATDMPSSPSTPWGKCFYGALVGLTAALFIVLGVKYEYMSWSILLMNGAAPFITRYLRPRVWGMKPNYGMQALHMLGVCVAVVAICLIAGRPWFSSLHMVQYLLYVLIAYCIVRFVWVDMKQSTL